ncbi:MAG: hypothetical protein WCT46_06255 [Candidatus Gracilibacteria bacterium]
MITTLLKLSIVGWYWITTVVIVEVFWLIFWLWTRCKYPKVPKNKVGIILAIETEKDLERNKVYRDFVFYFRKLINEAGFSDIFEIVDLNEYQSSVTSRLLSEQSQSLIQFRKDGVFKNLVKRNKWESQQKKIGGHLYIWGEIRKRMDKESKYIFDIDGLIVHKPLKVGAHNIIAKDFIESWFKRIAFSDVFELTGFEISAELVFVISKYIIGLASLISGDPVLALKLHTVLRTEFEGINKKYNPVPPNLLKIRSKLDALIAEENILIANWYLRNNQITQADKYLADSFLVKQDNYGAYIFSALRKFQNNDLDGCLGDVMKAKKIAVNNQIWRYDYAFLLVWKGNYERGLNQYQKITENTYPGEDVTVNEIYIFQQGLWKNKKWIPALFILGFIMYKKLDNLPQSHQYFERFIEESSKVPEFARLVQVTQSYLSDIKKEMQLN